MESLIGKTIDNYRVLEVIGRGGMGVVFKALDDNLEKIVALKMIDPFLARDENFVRRFKTEAKALARLENPNIVGVHALRNTEAGLFMVMEYVESQPLSNYLRDNGPFNIKDAISILKQLLNAIGHAHEVGVIHRDIKPSNILLCDNGKIKVTDFGLAKVVQQKSGASTVTQARAGTLYYMSPEQIKGLKNVDIRSDLYSLGMTVYEMLTGRVPFDKTDSDFTIQRQIVDGEIPSPVKFNATIPKKMIKIIQKSINKEPEKRYQSANEMLKDILEFEKNILEERKEKVKDKVRDKTIIKEIKPVERKKKSLKPVIILSSIAISVIVGLFFLINSNEGENPKSALLSIVTTPEKAEIFLNNNPIGESPVENYKIRTEVRQNIRIRKEGFIPVDTSLSISYGSTENLTINLAKLSANEVQSEQTVIQSTEEKKSGTISITTNPPDASVFMDGANVGLTPYVKDNIIPGNYKLLLRKKGYADISESLKISAGKTYSVSKNLTSVTTLKINSEPSGADVLLNNKSAGKTPYTNNQTLPGEYNVTISKPGYKTYTDKIKITDTQAASEINAKLDQIAGKIEILVRPFGSIYVNEQLKVKDTSSPFSTELPGGNHRIKVTHPTYGSIEKEIKIKDEKTVKFNFDLSRVMKLTVISNPPNCEIFINGQSSQKYTPTLLSIPPGSHKVQVKKDGFTTIPEEKFYDIPAELYEEAKDREDRIEFKLERIQ
jgi:eukaryotic-like serine/threonine-protein kinase